MRLLPSPPVRIQSVSTPEEVRQLRQEVDGGVPGKPGAGAALRVPGSAVQAGGRFPGAGHEAGVRALHPHVHQLSYWAGVSDRHEVLRLQVRPWWV